MLQEIERVNVKVLRIHKVALRSLAELEGESISVVLRGIIREAALKRGVWPVEQSDLKRQVPSDRKI